MKPIEAALQRINSLLSEISEISTGIVDVVSRGGWDLGDLAAKAQKIRDLRNIVRNLIVETIARYQPTASDLRYLIAGLEISYGLYRFSRYALDMANVATEFSRHGIEGCRLERSGRMAGLVVEMVRRSVAGFMGRNAEEARRVIDLDSEVDKILREAIERSSTSENPCATLDLLLAIYLERIADHSVYIASDTIYVV